MGAKNYALMGCLVVALAGCASGDDKKMEVPRLMCPQVAVVRGVDTVRDFGGDAAEPAQLVAAAKMTGIEGDCDYRDDGIDIAFRVLLLAQRGPRLGGDRVSFPYFVAVLNPQGEILNKNQMTAEIVFDGDDRLAKHDEAMHVVVPMAPAGWAAGPQHRVLVGFQITPAQQKAIEPSVPLAPKAKVKKPKRKKR